jgi:ATP-dependent DNA helicase RecG
LPDGETKEMFFKGISTPRNKELMRVLSDLKYVEQTGYGVPEVLKHYDKNVFDIEENYINVSIPYDAEVMASMHVTDAGAENGAENGADNNLEEKIIRELKTNSKITRKELSSKLQIGTTSVYRILNRLKEKKKIRRVGPDKGGHWEIID